MTVATLSPELIEALERCRATFDTGHTLPPVVYTDAGIAALELDHIFGRGWVGVGRADRFAVAGDYATVEVGHHSAIVVRHEDETLRAFANTCRHRGAQIVTGGGNCARLRCPFHAWTYALDGRLVGAPSMHQTVGFDRADHGLHEFATAERAGFAFVSFDTDPVPIDEWLGDFPELHAPWPLAQLRTARRREFTVECNWKAFADVFNEYYHLPYVHADSIGDLYPEPDPVDAVTGQYASQFGPTDGAAGLLQHEQQFALPPMPGLAGPEAKGVRYTWLYPNMVTAIAHDSMWMYEVYPDGPDRVRCAQVVCFPPDVFELDDFETRAQHYFDRHDAAIAEDIPMLEQQQRGLRSPHARQGRFSHLEPAVAEFASWYAGQLCAAARS